MADRFGESEHARERPPRTLNKQFLTEPTTWFAGAVIGMLIVFVGLGVDAYRHNHNAAEESLLSMSNPGHLLAAIGLALISISALVGLSITALRNVHERNEIIRRFVGVTASWVALGVVAISSLTYIGASGVTVGHSHGTTTTATADSNGAEAAGLVTALKDGGISPGGDAAPGSETDASKVAGALTQGADGNGGHVHDHGKQPTYDQVVSMSDSQLLPLFPADTVSAQDLPVLKQQIEQVHEVALNFPTPESAKAAGYTRTTSDVPFMGEHYLNLDLVRTGKFDPAHPQGLLYSKIDNGEEKLVGVWFLLVPGLGGNSREKEPAGFAGNLDLWHAHIGLCLVGLSGASEGETKESCAAKGGSFTADLRWMMHVWVAPEQGNPDGVFAYLNNDLYNKQVAAGTAAKPAQQNGTIAQ